ncbi:MAG TPA: hypothetical protein VJZ72_08565 [Candidatus Limnocylindrales bacterium]|nr:hypothetical protein [Candidatus Limnocylindrales bacterium]
MDTTKRLGTTRESLLAQHAKARAERNAAPLGSDEHRAAVTRVAEIEIEIARLERAMDPPLV